MAEGGFPKEGEKKVGLGKKLASIAGSKSVRAFLATNSRN